MSHLQGGEGGDQGPHGPDGDPEGDQPEPSTWRPRDLATVLDGTWRPPEPTIGRRSDGQGICYPGRDHSIVSETEGGKTWLAVSISNDEMHAGNHVVYLDFEDDEGGVVGRLLTLGVPRQMIRERFHYIWPESPLQGRHLDELLTVLRDTRPTLGVIDGVTEGMALHGLNPLDNVDVARFRQRGHDADHRCRCRGGQPRPRSEGPGEPGPVRDRRRPQVKPYVDGGADA